MGLPYELSKYADCAQSVAGLNLPKDITAAKSEDPLTLVIWHHSTPTVPGEFLVFTDSESYRFEDTARRKQGKHVVQLKGPGSFSMFIEREIEPEAKGHLYRHYLSVSPQATQADVVLQGIELTKEEAQSAIDDDVSKRILSLPRLFELRRADYEAEVGKLWKKPRSYRDERVRDFLRELLNLKPGASLPDSIDVRELARHPKAVAAHVPMLRKYKAQIVTYFKQKSWIPSPPHKEGLIWATAACGDIQDPLIQQSVSRMKAIFAKRKDPPAVPQDDPRLQFR